MKKYLLISLFFLAFIISGSVDKKPKQFKVTFEVTYNSISLERAAELEKIFTDKFGDACTINIKVGSMETISAGNIRFNTDSMYISPYGKMRITY